MNNKKGVRNLAVAGLFTAIIFIVTGFLHVPTHNGYTHFGDAFIYLVASILPLPYAIVSSAVGAALADGSSGFVIWMPATIIVKSLTACFFTSKKDRIITKRNIIAIIPSLVVCACGYGFYEAAIITDKSIWSSLTAVLVTVPSYVIQVILSAVVYISIGIAMDKFNFKKRFK